MDGSQKGSTPSESRSQHTGDQKRESSSARVSANPGSREGSVRKPPSNPPSMPHDQPQPQTPITPVSPARSTNSLHSASSARQLPPKQPSQRAPSTPAQSFKPHENASAPLSKPALSVAQPSAPSQSPTKSAASVRSDHSAARSADQGTAPRSKPSMPQDVTIQKASLPTPLSAAPLRDSVAQARSEATAEAATFMATVPATRAKPPTHAPRRKKMSGRKADPPDGRGIEDEAPSNDIVGSDDERQALELARAELASKEQQVAALQRDTSERTARAIKDASAELIRLRIERDACEAQIEAADDELEELKARGLRSPSALAHKKAAATFAADDASELARLRSAIVSIRERVEGKAHRAKELEGELAKVQAQLLQAADEGFEPYAKLTATQRAIKQARIAKYHETLQSCGRVIASRQLPERSQCSDQ
ncbi:hypothetical protein DIPPA_61259 [Diplonema papillatum]|nr:hypothetical protein DIPPA_61259 [Diplonema papillatum]